MIDLQKRANLAAQHSAMLNKAYHTLKNPLLRAQYLVSQHGQVRDEERETLDDKAFIMQVMDARESVEAAVKSDELKATLDLNKSQSTFASQ